MKTNVLKFGLRAMMALTGVAMATILASCAAEDFKFNEGDVVTPTPVTVSAKASISAVVAYDGKMLSTNENELSVTFNNAKPDANGSYVLQGNPELAAIDVKVVATYKEMTGEAIVHVPALKAGEGFAYTALVCINSEDNVTVSLYDENSENDPILIAETTKQFVNDTNDDMYVPFTYKEIVGRVISDIRYYNRAAEDESVRSMVDYVLNSWNVGYNEVERTVMILVQPGQIVNAKAETVKDVQNRVLKEKATRAEIVIGTDWLASFVDTTWKTKTSWDTIIDPAHGSHGATHGHGHGDSANAGGGIADAD